MQGNRREKFVRRKKDDLNEFRCVAKQMYAKREGGFENLFLVRASLSHLIHKPSLCTLAIHCVRWTIYGKPSGRAPCVQAWDLDIFTTSCSFSRSVISAHALTTCPSSCTMLHPTSTHSRPSPGLAIFFITLHSSWCTPFTPPLALAFLEALSFLKRGY